MLRTAEKDELEEDSPPVLLILVRTADYCRLVVFIAELSGGREAAHC